MRICYKVDEHQNVFGKRYPIFATRHANHPTSGQQKRVEEVPGARLSQDIANLTSRGLVQPQGHVRVEHEHGVSGG